VPLLKIRFLIEVGSRPCAQRPPARRQDLSAKDTAG